MSEVMFTVHAVRPDETGSVEILFRTEEEAREYARGRSRDSRVLSASVTRFHVGQLGTRHPVTWYVDGEEQPPRYHGPIRQLYPTADAKTT